MKLASQFTGRENQAPKRKASERVELSCRIARQFEKAGDYLETRLDLFKLRAVDKTSDFTSSLVSRIAIATILILAIFMVNIGLALWVGELVGRVYLGFFIVAAFYALLALLIHVFRKLKLYILKK